MAGETDIEMHRYGIFICYESVFADEVRAICAPRR